MSNPINKFITKMPLIFVILYTLVFAPIIEELGFRAWGCKKKKWKWISFSVSTIYISIVSPYFGIIYACLFLSIIFFLKNKPKQQIFSFLVLTSIAFASLHYDNLQLIPFICSFPQYLGIAIFLTYLTLRFNLFASIVFHIINNCIYLFAFGLLTPKEEPIKFENKTYSATLTNLSYKSKLEIYSSSALHGDYIKMNNLTLHSIVEDLILDNDTTYFVKENDLMQFKKYYLYAIQKDSSILIDQKELLNDICKIKKIKIDTIQKQKEVYFLNIRDWNKVMDNAENIGTNNLKTTCPVFNLCSILSSSEQTIIPEKGIYNKTIIIDSKLISQKRPLKEIKRALDSCYTITFRKKDTIVNIIRIQNK
jgi:membrane protease YdiL (CAAX protease family)